MTELKLWKKVGDEIIIAEVAQDYRYSTTLHLFEDSRL